MQVSLCIVVQALILVKLGNVLSSPVNDEVSQTFRCVILPLEVIYQFQVKCPTPGGISPHPTYCLMFIDCTSGHLEYSRCDYGFLFDSDELVCKQEHLVDCGSREFYYFNSKGVIPMETYWMIKYSSNALWEFPSINVLWDEEEEDQKSFSYWFAWTESTWPIDSLLTLFSWFGQQSPLCPKYSCFLQVPIMVPAISWWHLVNQYFPARSWELLRKSQRALMMVMMMRTTRLGSGFVPNKELQGESRSDLMGRWRCNKQVFKKREPWITAKPRATFYFRMESWSFVCIFNRDNWPQKRRSIIK